MRPIKTKPFDYFVGVQSLEELVNKDSRVCVVNILGSESRKVTPVSHEYSNGNIVAGVQYGKHGVLETKRGDIPVYQSVRDVMHEGHAFDMGVIYLPPSAVSQAVSEMIQLNDDLKRIVIVTEKVSLKDSRNVRYICQEAGVDVIGANCLGVANIWDHVRVGGALGGDNPEESLLKGSVAIHSNSGNFTTTIAEYLKTKGFGITTAVSSGKDVIIHFALPEFLFAAQNDSRTKAIVLYVEPGGYYERMALEMIRDRKFGFNKPIVVCVTGRWKKNITRAVGHAGALAGSGDDAQSKEQWFDEYFGVDCFDPKHPVVSKRGVRVSSIQAIPEAMKHVYEKMDEATDFAPQGDLSLKPWLGDKLIQVPVELDIPIVRAMPPYDKQIYEINKQVGAHYLRQPMRNRSGASRMDPATQVSELHGKSVLELSQRTMEENIYFSLAKVMPEEQDIPTINLILNLFLKMDESRMDWVDIGRNNGASPNAYIGSQIALIGNKSLLAKTKAHVAEIINIIREFDIDERTTEFPKEMDDYIKAHLLTREPQIKSEVSTILLKEIKKSTKVCTAVRVCQHIITLAECSEMEVRDTYEFLLASIATCIFWTPMLEKRITRETVEDAVTYFYVISRIVAYSVIDRANNKFWKKLVGERISNINASFTENAFKILFNRQPTKSDLYEFTTLIGLTITNGPGTISAKGAKESVSARNYISMAFVGFLSNTGFAHGGNGFEAVKFLMDNFAGTGLSDPGAKAHSIDLSAIALRVVRQYAQYKQEAKEVGTLDYAKIPCVNHPVFKGNDINIDPREKFVRGEFERKEIYNIFLDFYHRLVQSLYDEGVTKNVFCVNIDAVLAVISLKLVWNEIQSGTFTEKQVQDLVFTMFLFGRAIGIAAEIADHRDKGTDMDCRTPQKELRFVL
ncbi:MAG TPA: CoA-binding protein [Bacteroidota bacterium]|nr:CoA-binding protein [Bacteroidota bacterium]